MMGWSFSWQVAVLPTLLWLSALHLGWAICQGNLEACGATPKTATQCGWYVFLLCITVGALDSHGIFCCSFWIILPPSEGLGKLLPASGTHPRKRSVASQTCLFTSWVIQQQSSRQCTSTSLPIAWFGTLSKVCRMNLFF